MHCWQRRGVRGELSGAHGIGRDGCAEADECRQCGGLTGMNGRGYLRMPRCFHVCGGGEGRSSGAGVGSRACDPARARIGYAGMRARVSSRLWRCGHQDHDAVAGSGEPGGAGEQTESAIAVALGRTPRCVHLDLLGLKRDVGIGFEMGGPSLDMAVPQGPICPCWLTSKCNSSLRRRWDKGKKIIIS